MSDDLWEIRRRWKTYFMLAGSFGTVREPVPIKVQDVRDVGRILDENERLQAALERIALADNGSGQR